MKFGIYTKLGMINVNMARDSHIQGSYTSNLLKTPTI